MSPQQTIAHYRITAKLGEGGMGEVWRATDSKLGREVAIKILPEAFARDAGRMARFEREAKVLASLNHPRIAQIYGVEDRALIMELAEGESPKGPIPFEDAWKIALQIAEALEYAHEKGVVHRDLKPANVKVTPDGQVKLLDFGLAKAFGEGWDSSGSDPENSPTITVAATTVGTVLGTAAYMAPEQAKGKRADKRCDIWAWGVLLYELLMGERLFQGETTADTMAQVLTKEPDLKRVPTQVRKLLGRCLEKDSKRRLRDIGDAADLVEDRSLTRERPDAVAALKAAVAMGVAWAVAGVATLALSVLAVVHFRETPPTAQVLHLSVPIPNDSLPGFVALSPDGQRLAVSTNAKGQIWIRSLNSPRIYPLPGTERGRAPFWSPDGKSLGFFADGKLKVISASGGPAQPLCDADAASASGTWNRDGVILFNSGGVIERVNASGGACTTVLKPADAGNAYLFPVFLPDGKHFLFLASGANEAKRGIYVASPGQPTPRRLLADDSNAIYVPSTTGKKQGYLLFLRGNADAANSSTRGALMAQPFDADTLQLEGDVFPAGAEASFSLNVEQMNVSASANGVLAYADLGQGVQQLTWMDRSGRDLGRIGEAGEGNRLAGLSPDGKFAAAVRADGVWLYDLERGAGTRLIPERVTRARGMAWSPDGNWLASSGSQGLYLKNTKDGSKERLLLESRNDLRVSDWSRNGRYLLYTELDGGSSSIWYLEDPLNASTSQKPRRFEAADGQQMTQGQLSPDGRWLAYTALETGAPTDVYVRPFPSGPGRWKIPVSGTFNAEPRWSRDGKELFFLEVPIPRNRLMAAPVRSGSGGEFQAGTPQPLFEFAGRVIVAQANIFLYSPSPDGKRFLVMARISDAQPSLNIISNWERAVLGMKP